MWPSIRRSDAGTGGWNGWAGTLNIQPPDEYASWQGRLYSLIDQRMRVFLYDDVKTEIRLEEIAWGGVGRDGIPDLINPQGLSPEEAAYLSPDDRVFGVSINGEHHAIRCAFLTPMRWPTM